MSDFPLPEPQLPAGKQALDIQHDTDPANDEGKARRIPHLGHALLFFAVICLSFLLCGVVWAFTTGMHKADLVQPHPTADVITLLSAYIIALLAAVPLFSALWQRSFWQGVHWTWRAARLRWGKLVFLGLGLSVAVNLAEHFSKQPDTTELLKLLQNPTSAWILALGGGFLVPIMEEIAFRGFLLPALATAYDWFSLERTPAGIQRWQQTTVHTTGALVFGAVISSLTFASIHGFQLHWAKGPLLLLFVVALVLATVRIKTRSVAASTLVHFAYNGLIFLGVAIATGGFRHLDRLK